MSGSPLLIQNEEDDHFYAVGMHHGLLKGERKVTGGVFFNKTVISTI